MEMVLDLLYRVHHTQFDGDIALAKMGERQILKKIRLISEDDINARLRITHDMGGLRDQLI